MKEPWNVQPRSARFASWIVDHLWPTVSMLGCAIFVVVMAYFQIGGCRADDGEALNAIESHGFEDIELGDAVLGKCAEHESSRAFTAYNPMNKRHVHGTVCCGGMQPKACTLRW